MRIYSRILLSRLLLLAALLLAASCGGSGSTSGEVPRDTTRTVIVGPAGNVNITNPTLSVADNTAVAQGRPLNLVWSDEFEGAQLDPEAWFFESGDGS